MPSLPARAFRRAERTVAKPLERLVESETVIDALIRATALQGRAQRRVERGMRAYLHFWNVPALSDVRRLSQQMAYLERRVRELSRETAEPPVEERDGRAA
jgi:hypothetical protein